MGKILDFIRSAFKFADKRITSSIKKAAGLDCCDIENSNVKIFTANIEDKALEQIRMLAKQDGIYTTSVNESTIDECPMAYKPAAEIINNLFPTVEVRKVLKPVYNFKASE